MVERTAFLNLAQMAQLHSQGGIKGDTVQWLLEGNQLDFTLDEFTAMVHGVRSEGLFFYLERERPALLHQLLVICRPLVEQDDDLQFVLEQIFLDLVARL